LKAKKSYELKPIRQPPRRYNIAAFDIEGDAERFILGAVALPDGCTHVFFDPRSLVAFIQLHPEFLWVAHNAMYDVGVLIRYMKEWEIHEHRSRLVKAVYRRSKKATVIIDSSWFFPMKLEKVGQAIGLDKLDIGLPESGGKVDWDRLLAEVGIDRVAEYCIRDAQIVQKAMSLFQDEINALGGQLRFTLASTAFDLFRRAFLDRTYRIPERYINRLCREAYYGGRVENLVEGLVRGVNIYDVNSMYPFVMLKYALPDPDTLIGPIYNGSMENILRYEGVSRVRVRVPKQNIPPLPYRHEGKTIYPYGRLTGTWTHLELREAIRDGAVVEKIEWQIIARDTCRPFAKYVETLYERRLQYKRNRDPRELVIKIMLNSLYGKFGENPDENNYRIFRHLDSYPHDAEIPEGAEPLEIEGEEWVGAPSPRYGVRPNYITIWAAYITAAARVELRRRARMTKQVFYMDTDSLVTSDELPTGDGLGELKLEYCNVDIEIAAPKLYIATKDGVVVKSASRGIPKELIVTYIRERQVTFWRPLKIREAFRRNLLPSQWQQVTKRYRESFPKRVPGKELGTFVLLLPWHAEWLSASRSALRSLLQRFVEKTRRILSGFPIFAKGG